MKDKVLVEFDKWFITENINIQGMDLIRPKNKVKDENENKTVHNTHITSKHFSILLLSMVLASSRSSQMLYRRGMEELICGWIKV